MFWFVEYEFRKISSTAQIVLYNKYSVKKEINFKLKKKQAKTDTLVKCWQQKSTKEHIYADGTIL